MRLPNILTAQYRNTHKLPKIFSVQSCLFDRSMGWLAEIKNHFLPMTLVLFHLRTRLE